MPRKPRNPTGLAVAPAKRRWNEGIKFDFKTLFVDMGKALAQVSYTDYLDAAITAAAGIKSVSKKTDPEQLARLWILRALTRAIYQLVAGSYTSAHNERDM